MHHLERVLHVDSSLNILHKFLPLETKAFPISNDPAFTSWKNERYLTITLDPFIYQISGDSLVSIIQFDFGKYNVTPNFWKAEDKALIQNPELLENADPEMDMFILLCTMK